MVDKLLTAIASWMQDQRISTITALTTRKTKELDHFFHGVAHPSHFWSRFHFKNKTIAP
jgi:hypothetical protein